MNFTHNIYINCVFIQIQLKVSAPHKPGIYQYQVILRSDSYIDFDLFRPIKVRLTYPQVHFVYIFFYDALVFLVLFTIHCRFAALSPLDILRYDLCQM